MSAKTQQHRGSTVRRLSKQHPAWWAFVLHRISGIALAVFLPFHFLLLGTALGGTERLDGFLAWADHPLVKFAEFGLVALLAAHLVGGLRVMALEWLAWTDGQKNWLVAAIGIGIATGLLFLLSASA